MSQTNCERVLRIAHVEELSRGRQGRLRSLKSVLPGAKLEVGLPVRVVKGGIDGDQSGILKGFGRVGRYGTTGLVHVYGAATAYELVLCVGESAGMPTLFAIHEADVRVIDERPGAYYVSAKKGQQWVPLLGPFEGHEHALVLVDAARAHCSTALSGRDWFDVAFGTVRLDLDDSLLVQGRFNDEILRADERSWLLDCSPATPAQRCVG